MTKRKRKSDEAYTELRRQIIVAELPPNSLIDEKALVEELGVGRTPLREAVLRLEQQGLVVSLGRRGYVVAGASKADLMRGYELRRELECFTAGLSHQGPASFGRWRSQTASPSCLHQPLNVKRAWTLTFG